MARPRTKSRVPLYQRDGYVDIDPGATFGAQLGVNLYYNGVLVRPQDIFNVPTPPPEQMLPNVYALALTTTAGFYVVIGSGQSATRKITVSPRLLIENDDGVDGDPFLDIADTVLVADGALSALRVVVAEDGAARYPDIDDTTDALRAIGITVNAADDAADVRVRTDGELVDASWAWTPGVVWCGADGVLTQSIPATGWLLEVGRVAAPDRIVIDLQTPYIRSV